MKRHRDKCLGDVSVEVKMLATRAVETIVDFFVVFARNRKPKSGRPSEITDDTWRITEVRVNVDEDQLSDCERAADILLVEIGDGVT